MLKDVMETELKSLEVVDDEKEIKFLEEPSELGCGLALRCGGTIGA